LLTLNFKDHFITSTNTYFFKRAKHPKSSAWSQPFLYIGKLVSTNVHRQLYEYTCCVNNSRHLCGHFEEKAKYWAFFKYCSFSRQARIFDRIRVARLRQFSPTGCLFTLGSFLKTTEVAQIYGLLFPNVSVLSVFRQTTSLATFWVTFSQTRLVTLVGYHDLGTPAKRIRVARFLLVQTYQIGKNIPNNHKLYQTAINYTKRP
jgi:hypothetical protein